MNFKVFLKNNLISESTFLFEEGNDEQKNAFIQSAYKRVIPNGTESNPDKMWNAVRSKAYYKLTKNSKPETRKAVQQAKGALNAGKTRFNLEDKELSNEEKGQRETSKKILDHLEDWDKKDFEELRELLQNEIPILKQFESLDDLRDGIKTGNGLKDADLDTIFTEVKKAEEDVKDEKEWKDKTFDDLESIKDEDFAKIKDKLKETLGTEFENIDQLKDYLKDKPLNDEQIKNLDNLLDSEEAKVPATTGQQEPQETKVPQDPKEQNKVPVSTTNQEILDNIQKKQQEQELNDHLKKIGLDITSLDTGNTEVVQKILDSGDPLLYDTYIAKNLPETSEIVQKIKKEEEERQRVQREALERRTDRFEELKQSGKVVAGIGVIFDVLASALSGKGNNFFETMAQKQTLAKGIAEGITTQLSGQYEAIISNEDSNHAKELDALKTDYDQRLKDLESQKADPSKTVAYKKLLAMASQKYSESLSKLKDETKSASQRVAKVSSLNVFMSTDDLSSLDPASKEQMIGVLSEKYPRQKIQGEDGTETDESDDAYLERIKSEAKNDDIQRIIDVANNDLAMCKEKEKELEDSFSKSLEDLKQNPEVQDEMKLAEQNYKNQKAIIESEYNKAVATENTRYEKTVHCLRKTMDENKRFSKNISVLAVYSENPMDIIKHEMASRNKRLQDRAKLETGTEIFNEENCPSDPEVLQDMFNNASKGSEGKPKKAKKEKDIEDDDGDDDTPKKLKKPNGGEGNPGGEGVPGTGGQGDPGKEGGQGEPDPDETKKQKVQTVQAIKDTVSQINKQFEGKDNAKKRFNEFLESKGLKTEDIDNLDDDSLKKFNDALEEFKTQKFPTSFEECNKLGITDNDGNPLTKESFDTLIKDKKWLKEKMNEYGFEDNDEGKGKETKKTEPITVKTDNLDDIKKLGLEIKGTDGNVIDLNSIDNDKWKELLDDEGFKNKLKEQLQSPEVLKNLSGEDAESEKTEIDGLADEEQDKEKTKLGDMNLKTLWTLLNNEGISIRALPGYEANMAPDKKANLIRDYIKKHKEGNWSSLNESKTSQSRLSSLIEANDRKIQKKSLKKFAELLVNDVRTFG